MPGFPLTTVTRCFPPAGHDEALQNTLWQNGQDDHSRGTNGLHDGGPILLHRGVGNCLQPAQAIFRLDNSQA